MIKRSAHANWQGSFTKGIGTVTLGDQSATRFSAFTRFSKVKEPNSNPEELLGGALAGCFSMALSLELSEAGHRPASIDSYATVSLTQTGNGFEIDRIFLTCRAEVPGIDPATFDTIARQTAETCPIGKALRTVVIEYDVALEQDTPPIAA